MNREKILELVREFAKEEYSNKEFVEGKSAVLVSGRVFDEDDITTLVDSALDFHLTTYRYNDEFEKSLREFFGVKYALTCNSGSSIETNFLSFPNMQFAKCSSSNLSGLSL